MYVGLFKNTLISILIIIGNYYFGFSGDSFVYNFFTCYGDRVAAR